MIVLFPAQTKAWIKSIINVTYYGVNVKKYDVYVKTLDSNPFELYRRSDKSWVDEELDFETKKTIIEIREAIMRNEEYVNPPVGIRTHKN